MKLKLSKMNEKVLYVVSIAFLGLGMWSLNIDFYKEVSLLAYICTSIMALIAIIINFSNGISLGNRFIRNYNLQLLSYVLIFQIVIQKVVLLGIIINLFCFIADSSRYIYFNAKEKELKNGGNKQ